MTLSAKQRLFCANIARLIAEVPHLVPGGTCRFGEALRTPEQAALYTKSGTGIAASLHIERLAVDLLLDIDGVWQEKSEAYKPLGDYWKALHPDNRWGGDFQHRPDGNHFSMTPDGKRA